VELDFRWPIFLLGNLLLIALLRMVNDAVSTLGFYLSLPALLVLIPALHLPPRWGLLLAAVTALLYSAPYPGLGGAFVIVFGLGYVAFRHYSSQLRRFQRAQLLSALVIANSFLVLLQGILLAREIPVDGAYIRRVATDSLLSSIIMYPVGWWFIDLQYAALNWFGLDPNADTPPE